MSIKSLNPLSFWYNLSNNSKGRLCELLRVEECMFISMLKICGIIRQKVIKEKMSITIRKDHWISCINEYELNNVKCNTSKLKVS